MMIFSPERRTPYEEVLARFRGILGVLSSGCMVLLAPRLWRIAALRVVKWVDRRRGRSDGSANWVGGDARS
jgi:hypothetical protein